MCYIEFKNKSLFYIINYFLKGIMLNIDKKSLYDKRLSNSKIYYYKS